MDIVQKWNKNQKEYVKTSSNKMHSNYAEKVVAKIGESKGHILDLGGGTGSDAKYFLEQGFEVTLVDISDYALKIA